MDADAPNLAPLLHAYCSAVAALRSATKTATGPNPSAAQVQRMNEARELFGAAKHAYFEAVMKAWDAFEKKRDDAESWAQQGERLLQCQRKKIEELRRDGYDVGAAKDLLSTIEWSQRLRVARLSQILNERAEPARANPAVFDVKQRA